MKEDLQGGLLKGFLYHSLAPKMCRTEVQFDLCNQRLTHKNQTRKRFLVVDQNPSFSVLG